MWQLNSWQVSDHTHLPLMSLFGKWIAFLSSGNCCLRFLSYGINDRKHLWRVLPQSHLFCGLVQSQFWDTRRITHIICVIKINLRCVFRMLSYSWNILHKKYCSTIALLVLSLVIYWHAIYLITYILK